MFLVVKQKSLKRLRRDLQSFKEYMMTTQSELVAELKKATQQLVKIGNETSETLQKAKDLEDALVAAGNITPEVQEALDALKQQVQAVDDMVPDAAGNGGGDSGDGGTVGDGGPDVGTDVTGGDIEGTPAGNPANG